MMSLIAEDKNEIKTIILFNGQKILNEAEGVSLLLLNGLRWLARWLNPLELNPLPEGRAKASASASRLSC